MPAEIGNTRTEGLKSLGRLRPPDTPTDIEIHHQPAGSYTSQELYCTLLKLFTLLEWRDSIPIYFYLFYKLYDAYFW